METQPIIHLKIFSSLLWISLTENVWEGHQGTKKKKREKKTPKSTTTKKREENPKINQHYNKQNQTQTNTTKDP